MRIFFMTFRIWLMVGLGAVGLWSEIFAERVELPKGAVVTYPDSNPFRDALRPVPKSALFDLEGFSVWDPSLIKVGDTYHLFGSRWPSGPETKGTKGWKQSHVFRATSKSLFGPYEFEEVVLHPSEHPWAVQGVHNPKITRAGDQFLLYHLGIPKWRTGFALSDSIEGPWVPFDKPVVKANNPALHVREDDSAYLLSKYKVKDSEGNVGVYMEAWQADNFKGPYELVLGKDGSRSRLPYGLELEDPSLWWANDRFNIVCTDWKGKLTGIRKAVICYTSKDGVEFELFSKTPVWSQADPIPFEDGSEMKVKRVERPQVFVNGKGEVVALLAAISTADDTDNHIVIRPVDHFVPGN